MAKPVCLSFQDLVACDAANDCVLSKVSGYVRSGGITAVLGASGSGKTVLLTALAGRMGEMPQIKLKGNGGSINVNGERLDGYTWSQQTRFSPSTNDHLIGVLSVKEHVMLSSRLAHGSDPNWDHEKEVDGILSKLDLTICEDTHIGTIYKRGISGGQQRRTCMAIELIAGAPITLMDEPTSGLDTTTALKCLDYLKQGVEGTERGAIVSIHQPNNEMLAFFDKVLLLVDGETMFFGSVSEMQPHFTTIGAMPPDSQDIPLTEHYLLESDNIFGHPVMDMIDKYSKSALQTENMAAVQLHQNGPAPAKALPSTRAGFFSQVGMLFNRLFKVSVRDLTLYYLQFGIQIVYGFLVGALFWDGKTVLDDRIETLFNTVTWVTALMIYVFVFKVMYFNDAFIIQRHERANSMYSAFTIWLADLLLNLMMFPGYLLGGIIAYYMIGFKDESFAFTLLNYYVGVFAAEQVPNFVVQFTAPNLGFGFIMAQGALLILFMFSGGTFIRNSEVDGTFWVWLKSISPFQHAGDSFMAGAWDFLDYTCPATFSEMIGPNNVTFGTMWCNQTSAENGTAAAAFSSEWCCVAQTKGRQVFPCDANDAEDGCLSNGLSVMSIFKEDVPDQWDSLLWLAIVGVGYRAVVLFLQVYPPASLVQGARHFLCSSNAEPTPVDRKIQNEGTAASASGKRTMKRKNSALTIKGADLTMSNISVTLKKKLPCSGEGRTLIENLSSVAKCGEITALMGPSGAGKTTLLNALSGMATYAKVSGTATVGKQPLAKELLGYVPQFDHLIGGFTVRETLTYSFTLKCDSDNSADDAVVEVAKVVGMDAMLDDRISSLTSGQRKLVSIADGLISKPTILFLDEPTTGLDSTAAHEVVVHIASVAKIGVTVIMTIHQPSAKVFGMLDSMLLLDKSGEVAFDGPTSLAVAHFEEHGFPTGPHDNAADVFLSAMDGEPAKSASWGEAFKANAKVGASNEERLRLSGSQRTVTIKPMYEPPSEMTRLAILIQRFSLLYWRVPDFYFYRLITITVFGILAGTLYADTPNELASLTEVTGCIFFAVWVSLYLSLGNIPICFRTRFDGQTGYAAGRHSIWAWCLAQFIASLAYVLLCAVVFIVLVHFIPGINDTAECFFYVVIMSWVMQLTMEAVDWCLIEATRNELLAVTAGMVVLGSLFIFAGFFIPVDEMVKPIFWMAYTLPTKYIFSGTLFAYLHGVDYKSPDGKIVPGDQILKDYFDVDYSGESDWRHWMDILIGVAFLLAFRFQHYQLMVMSTAKMGSSLPAIDTDGAPVSSGNKVSAEPGEATLESGYLSAKAGDRSMNKKTSISHITAI